MKRVAIIGAGISGLSLAQMLKERCDLTVFEAASEVGGIARVVTREGIPFHLTGGHCFNSKNHEVLDFIFQNISCKENWHLVERDAKILWNQHFLDYPIELSLKKLILKNPRLGFKCLKDFLRPPGRTSQCFESFLRSSFGDTLCDIYFIPYNHKIWGRHPREMGTDWVDGKLPQRRVTDVLKSFWKTRENKMVHAQFYYPKRGDNHLVKSLAFGIDVQLNSPVKRIERTKDSKFIVQGETFDHIVYTGALNKLHHLLEVSEDCQKKLERLKINQITTSLWRSSPQDFLWCYDPNPDHRFHRYVQIGDFLENKRPGYMTAEAQGDLDIEQIKTEGAKIPFLHELVDFHHSKQAYLVFEKETREEVNKIRCEVEGEGLSLLGRFAEWKYLNMDDCIERSIELASRII